MNAQTLDRIAPTSMAALCFMLSVPFIYLRVNPHLGIMLMGTSLFLFSIVVCEAVEDEVLPEFIATGGLLIILYSLISAIVKSSLWPPLFLLLFVVARFKTYLGK